jgi:DNA-binding transcriptional LysR family regulator
MKYAPGVPLNWDDGRLFLAVARAGQMLAASRALGVSQATVGRRITALEAALGTQLLERRTDGCRLTEGGRSLLAVMEEAEASFSRAQAEAAGRQDEDVAGTVRIGTPDGFGVSFLAPHLKSLAARHPRLRIELVPVPRAFSLSQREADIAVMVGRPSEGRLLVRKLTDYTLGLYASGIYAQEHGLPATQAELAGHRLVGYVDDLIPMASMDYGREFLRAWRSDIAIASATGQFEAVKAGAGIGILHDFIARPAGGLVRVLPELSVRRSYWTVVHETLKELARVRAVLDFLAETVRSKDALFVHEAGEARGE